MKLMIAAIFTIFPLIFAQQPSFSIDFVFTETSVNRALVSQFNEPNFIFKTFTGTINIPNFGNANYTLELNRPNIDFANNNLDILLSFHFNAVLGSNVWNYDFEVNPNIDIPQSSISTTQVEAFLVDLPAKVNSLTDIPQWLKDLVILKYNSYKPWLYPSKLLDKINSQSFLAQRPISINNIILSERIETNKLIITLGLEAITSQTNFQIYFVNENPDKLKIKPNISCTMVELWIWDVGSTPVLHKTNLNVSLNANEVNLYNLNYNYFNTPHYFEAMILFKTDATFYVKKFGGLMWQWLNATAGINY